jgi:hypothetical protein
MAFFFQTFYLFVGWLVFMALLFLFLYLGATHVASGEPKPKKKPAKAP